LSDPRRDDLAFRVYERVRDAVIEITGAPRNALYDTALRVREEPND